MGYRKLEQNKREKPISVIKSSAITGFFGGLFWGTFGLIAYFFHFTEIRPNVILEPWVIADWKVGWQGTVLSLFFLGIFGMIAAYIYYFTLKRFESFWIGIVYGIVLFLLVFFVFNPLFPNLNPITELKGNTIVTTVCQFVLFGVFIGYSISYDYYEMVRQEQKEREKVEEKGMD